MLFHSCLQPFAMVRNKARAASNIILHATFTLSIWWRLSAWQVEQSLLRKAYLMHTESLATKKSLHIKRDMVLLYAYKSENEAQQTCYKSKQLI